MHRLFPHPPARILVDIDGVLANTDARTIELANAEYGANATIDDADGWNATLPGTEYHFGEIIEDLEETQPERYYSGMDVIDGARDALTTLLDTGYEVVLATHRPPHIHEITKRWLTDNDIPYTEFVDDVPKNKGELTGDLLIDDYHVNVRRAATSGMPSILFAPPNTDPTHHPDHDHISVAHNGWDDIREAIPNDMTDREPGVSD